ncbi:unnamed protein product [Lathyrus oleraceus]|uniref:Uncharacterized protein n=1 Tax=Pisum sativum TaxID=3888 RepID=A0A9D5AMJ0_PEA|nr:uncharacterized protein LOC127086782 isoform X2 [Pisum sativum]KAI5412746.1 hypothetical protein KIW84_057394 [Pisum sativum]
MEVFQIILRVFFMAILIKLAMATNHIVGGPNGGWDTGSADLQFSVGDNLAASPSIADSPTISIIPSAAPEETTFGSPADSPESPSLFFETQTETPTFSSQFPSSVAVPPDSLLAQHSQDASDSWFENENL